MSQQLLEIKGLKTYFKTDNGTVPAVDDLDLTLNKGETLAIVGESGSGKSVTALSTIGLIPSPPGKIVGGQIIFKGRDLLSLNDKEMQQVRGNDIAMIFQEPMTSLNPLFTVGWQIGEAIRLHQGGSKEEIKKLSIEMLRVVGIPSPEKRIKDYPHQMSGGMRQRVMIAMALSCRPDLLIADEPTTALDVTIQAQILDLIIRLKEKYGTAVLLITHDLGVVADIADRVMIMYCGKIVEYTDIDTFLESPKHPYSIGLIDSIPKMDEEVEELISIDGSVPDFRELAEGCSFSPRCPKCLDKCLLEKPPYMDLKEGHKVCCWLYSE